MKTLVAVILALGVGFAAAYVLVSKQKDAQLAPAKEQPAVAVAPPAAPVEKVVMVAAPTAPAQESPQDILDDLVNIKLGSGSARNAGLRSVVFKLETLSQRGQPAVPAIRTFLARNVDVNYSQTESSNTGTNQADGNVGNNRGNRNGNGGGFGGGFGGNNRGGARRARNLETMSADWVVPPSLRLGLVGTLKEVGGAESEQTLADMLNSTGRGVEVAYLTVVLEELAPGKYRKAAISAATELLMSPLTVDNPDRLDELSKSYLYGVLEFYKDTSFAINAQQMLIGKDGRLDQDAMDYLATVMKDQSVSALYAAYKNSALSNQFDKMSLGRNVLNYVGQNSQANQMFNETLSNPELDARLKAMVIIQQAGGGFGPFASETPTDPQIISGKLNVLKQLQSQYASDETLSAALTATIDALSGGPAVDPRQILGGGRGGGRGGFGGGFGGPPGGGN